VPQVVFEQHEVEVDGTEIESQSESFASNRYGEPWFGTVHCIPQSDERLTKSLQGAVRAFTWPEQFGKNLAGDGAASRQGKTSEQQRGTALAELGDHSLATKNSQTSEGLDFGAVQWDRAQLTPEFTML
jgi:hypothetical protein